MLKHPASSNNLASESNFCASSSSFARTVALPGNVDAAKASATLKDGVLEIKLTKAEGSKRRTIAVQ